MLEQKRWADLVQAGEWFHLARFRFLPRRLSRLHTHDFPELFWVEEGTGRHDINGQCRQLDAGDLLFIRAADRHRLEAVYRDGFLLVNLAFAPGVLKDLLRRHPRELAPFYPSGSALPARHRLSREQLKVLLDGMGELARVPRSRFAVEHFLLNVFHLLHASPAPTEPPLPDWLARACREIRRPDQFAGGSRAFVKLAGRTPEHVARACRSYLGTTPSAFVNQVRMAHAARELRLDSKPIVEIALECGLNNLSHFYSLFRATHGEPPRKYRLRHHRTVA